MPDTQPTARSLEGKLRADLKETVLVENRLRGIASVMGNLDYGQDVIFPGAFKSCLSAFLKNGFVAAAHEWDELPIAMPLSAQEDGNALVTEAEFHSTQDAQDARIVCKERLANGLSVGLSIGFQSDPKGCHYFESGQNLLNFASDNGYDLKMFDAKSIKAYDGWCRGITKIAELFEYSVVTVPMNPMACVTEAKQYDLSVIQTERNIERFLRDVGFNQDFAKKFISISKGIFLQRDAGVGEPSAETKSDGETDETSAPTTDQATETDQGASGTPETPTTKSSEPSEPRIVFTLGGRIPCQL